MLPKGGRADAPHKLSGMRLVVLAVVLLNLLDAVFTLVWVNLGVAEEANALLAHVLDQSAVAFVVVKMGLVSSGLALLWSQRQHKLATGGLVIAFVTYIGLLLYHFYVAAVAVEYLG